MPLRNVYINMPHEEGARVPAENAPDADAYAQLLAQIVRGDLAPGLRLTEPMLAERLGLSRTPVREAMHRLQLEGLLVAAGGGSRPRMAVAPLDIDEARAVYQTTGLLEGAGARVLVEWPVARRRVLATALRIADQEFRGIAREPAPDPALLFEKHHAFHQRLVDGTATSVARALLHSLAPRLARYEWFHGPLLQVAGLPFTPTYDEHHAIVVAVRSGSADDVEVAIRTNWTNAAERLAEAITRARAAIGSA
jgi:DNA-binding GntR family transcriptional regulator